MSNTINKISKIKKSKKLNESDEESKKVKKKNKNTESEYGPEDTSIPKYESESVSGLSEEDDEDKELTEEDERRITYTMIVTDTEDDESYTIGDTKIVFVVDVDNENSKINISGSIYTDYLFNNTEIKSIKSWRYKINDIVIHKITFDTETSKILYEFTAGDYESAV